MIPPVGSRREGVVVAYDDQAGYGEVQAGESRYWFHCTELLDGSRRAEPGQRVNFRIVAGHLGRWEATELG